MDSKLPPTKKFYIPPNSERKECEMFWVNNQPFLASQGYMLRPRYHPGWIPSWKSDPKPMAPIRSYEDEHVIHGHRRWRIIDAVHIPDGSKVILKAVSLLPDEFELGITHFLSTEEMRKDPRNNAIPVLDAFPIPCVEDWAIIVMPMFRGFASPPFHCRSEFIELFQQLLAGLEFLHSENIAHRDISVNNIVMDHQRVLPKGYHFGLKRSHDGIEWELPTELRCRAGPVDYCYIDFEFSECFPEGREKTLISGIAGQRVPEVQDSDTLYNPFKADVYQLGVAMLDIFERYTGLDDFKPLLRQMASIDPDKRPTASEALVQFEAVVSRSSQASLSWRIWSNQLCDSLVPWFWARFLYRIFPPCRSSV
ncbi:kinase-like domain-containing protein [Desarmillaria tabescens]|uniref:Kinase-like domain-containing protein n=1 Tax=Armillaria tabescens TaxID=1929756 RepID=A0AA39K4M7_ARMTA|nr:kinase-like domain-containing protein [Desarmillaria tabescens]KAK0452113.1 kinase-like domain-containing protein [Desarmillaria tabescens]